MFIKVKTSELENSALDWAVAKCEYDNKRYNYGSPCFNVNTKRVYETEGLQQIGVNFAPSTDWKQGGPIIEREHISIEATRIGGLGDRWMATSGDCAEFADKPLIAAMRCYIASKLGNEVEIPEELQK